MGSHVIHKDLWKSVGGFSEEFYPGTGSDPDLNMKLWKKGVKRFLKVLMNVKFIILDQLLQEDKIMIKM